MREVVIDQSKIHGGSRIRSINYFWGFAIATFGWLAFMGAEAVQGFFAGNLAYLWQLFRVCVGLSFFGCGVFVLSFACVGAWRPFTCYCFGAGIYFAGLPSNNSGVQSLYFLAAMLGITTLLDFTLQYPDIVRSADRCFARAMVYGPVVFGFLLCVVALTIFRGDGEGLYSIFLDFAQIQLDFFAFLVVFVLTARWMVANPARRANFRLGINLASILVPGLPYVAVRMMQDLGVALDIVTAPVLRFWVLMFLLTPAAFAFGLWAEVAARGASLQHDGSPVPWSRKRS